MSEPFFSAGVILQEGHDYRPSAYPVPDGVVGSVRLGRLSIQSTEPQALIELAEALRSAASEIERVRREGGES